MTYWVGGRAVDCPVMDDSQRDCYTHSYIYHGSYGVKIYSVIIAVGFGTMNFYITGLYLGTSDRGGQTGFHRIKGGAKPLSVCASTHEAGGVWGHAPPENFGAF